ncbi:alpha/beta hydrolase [Actibacterium sp. D379-3]
MDYDDAYANGRHIDGAGAYPPRWAVRAQAFRDTVATARLDIPYGAHPRQRFDLFAPGGAPRGLVMFVHGGYWLRFDKSFWSHLAAGPLAAGWAVAMPSYRLAPEVRVAQITCDIRAALEAAAGLVAGPIRLTGHSAGGHLVARMLCADVGLRDAVAARLARVVPISALSDLRPLLHTAMNANFRMDLIAAEAESPIFRHRVLPVPVTAWVGGAELPAFLDQSRWLADAWPQAALHIAPGLHHFNVIDGLEQADSPLTAAVLAGGES